jgi:endonuclease III
LALKNQEENDNRFAELTALCTKNKFYEISEKLSSHRRYLCDITHVTCTTYIIDFSDLCNLGRQTQTSLTSSTKMLVPTE